MKKRIVCIDDDQSILDIVKGLLETTGEFEVSTFLRADEARNRLDSIKPNLILLDMMMPVMDGSATIKVLKAFDNSKDYPIVFLTSKAQAWDVQTYMSLGAAGVIPKPIDKGAFAYQVKMFCT